jgi:hypothetical protein
MQFRAGDARPRVRLRGPGRDIAVAVAVKLVALAVIYALFFSPAQRPAIDAGRVLDALTGPAPSSSDSAPNSGFNEVRP